MFLKNSLKSVFLIATLGLVSQNSLAGYSEGLSLEKKGNYKESIAEFLKEEGESKPEALFEVASIYMSESRGLLDVEKAVLHYKKASLLGHVQSMIKLGALYTHGYKEIIKKDVKRAAGYWKKAGDAGDKKGYWGLADLYERQGDTVKAKVWYEKASEMGDSVSSHALGAIYENEKNDKKALDYYSLGMKQGSNYSRFKVGYFHMMGKGGLEKDYKLAKQYFLKFKTLYPSYYGVYHNLGLIEESFGNIDQAREHYEKMVSVGKPDKGYELLGGLYLYVAKKTKENTEKALSYYEKSNTPLSALNAGEILFLGKNGVKENDKKGVQYLEAAYDAGLKKHAYNLGYAYSLGLGVDINHEKSIGFLKEAINSGNYAAQAHSLLAAYYHNGWGGLPENLEKSYKHYALAAESNIPYAVYMLGVFHKDGLGNKTVDLDKAKQYFVKAEKLGDKNAKSQLKALSDLENCSKKSLSLFGQSVECLSRDAVRKAVKSNKGKALREKNDYFADKYDASEMLDGGKELFVYYIDGKFAAAEYKIQTKGGFGNDINAVKEMLSTKYGAPDRYDGNASVGKASYTWYPMKGKKIHAYRYWPSREVYLCFENIDNFKKMNDRVDEIQKEEKKKKYSAHSNNF